MYLTNKYLHPANFNFECRKACEQEYEIGAQKLKLTVLSNPDDLYHVYIGNENLWPRNYCCSELSVPTNMAQGCRGSSTILSVSDSLDLSLKHVNGHTILESVRGSSFGLRSKAWVLTFIRKPNMQFYGLGEKTTPRFERSGRSYNFWNTDAFGDFHVEHINSGEYDPDYISIPYLIIKTGNEYIGIFVDNPGQSVISLEKDPPDTTKKNLPSFDSFYIGAENGPVSVYLIYGPSLRELTRKFQLLVGVSPLPPIWALGNHQSRWGYKDTADLHWLADNFEKYKFPVDGLWLDIDYMDGYRLFTFNPKYYKNPKKQIESVVRRGYQVVPIIDPGVKKEKGFELYEDGCKENVFCKNESGKNFVGLVWPGFTVFPDFSLQKTRQWWAERVKKFAEIGFEGAWLDMNDPSTGRIQVVDMLFEDGTAPHWAYHNQYAMLMAKASREGFLQLRPNKRPFLLSRSGFSGSQKWAYNWTGDNVSSYTHLSGTIGKTLNLALCGMPLNGSDVGGFAGNTNETLMVDWVKACFLFPFFRNHSAFNTRRQEPWTFSKRALLIMRFYVRLRYKLLPYLYNLFIEHERSGEAVLRPLFYDFKDTKKLPLAKIDDQFMIGSFIMQAPFTREKLTSRSVSLPGNNKWWRADTAQWIDGMQKITVTNNFETTPLFFREGAIVPMQKGCAETNRKNLSSIELYLFFRCGSRMQTECTYHVDDGETFDYKNGKRTSYKIKAKNIGKNLELIISPMELGFGEVDFTVVTVEKFQKIILRYEDKTTELKAVERILNYFGCKTKFYLWK